MTIKGPYGYTGGLNTKAGPYDLGQNQYSTGTDIEIEYGHLVPRLSYQNWTASGTHPGTGHTYLGAFQGVAVVGVGGGKIAYTPQTQGGTWTDITGSVTVASNITIGFATLNSILVMVDGTNAPIKWIGIGNNAGVLNGSPPSGSNSCAMVNNYMFLGSGSGAANSSRVQWSAVGDPTTWPSTNFVDFRKLDGDTVRAVYPFGEDCLIFKNYSLGRFYTTQNTGITNSLGPLVTISEKVGCVGPNCVDRLPDGRIVWLGSDSHAYIYDGSAITDISNMPYPGGNIQTTFDGEGFAAGNSCVKVYKNKNQVWFINSTDSTAFIYDYQLGVWIGKFVNPTLYSVLDFTYITSNIEYLIGGSTSGNVYQLDTTSNPLYTTLPVYACNIPFNVGGRDFIPRSVLFPIETSAGTSAGTVTWFYDAAGTSFSKTFTYTGSGSRRLVIPLTWQQKASYVNINIAFSSQVGKSWKLFPYYISDEVLV